MKKLKRRSTLSKSIIRGVISTLMLFGILVSVVGSVGYAESLKREYAQSTYRMADTAALLIDGDNIQKYLTEGENETYRENLRKLNIYCQTMYVSLIYVIAVDQSDYGRFQSLYNTVNNEVDDTDYEPWELGYKRDTTNDDYRNKYKAIYEEGSNYETVYRLHITDGKKQHITTLVPVKNSKGEVVGILCMQRPISELRNQIIRFIITIAALVTILSLISAIIVSRYNKKQVVKPIQKISDETVRFSSGDVKPGNLGAVSEIEEIFKLASSVDKMEEDMYRYIENLTAITAERERIGVELSIASTIQENSIPNIYPAFPQRKDFDIFASMDPAKEVGGDFYNFFLVDDDHLAFVIGDVSGKGIPAALFMMVTNILISDRTRMGGTPGEILCYVNDNICAHNKADMFVTLFLGILDLSTGRITASNAGHDDAIICRKNGEVELHETKHGLVVGAMSGVEYKDFEIQLTKGDKLFLYTDGVPEATNKDEELFTMERTLESLNKNKVCSPEEVLAGVRADVNEFVGDAPQFDDLTMLCLEYKEKGNKNVLTVDATNENLSKVMDFVDGALEETDCSMKDQMKIDLSVEEVFVNIANYAYGNSVGKAEIITEYKDNEFTIIFKDGGKPYNPLDKKDPDTTLSAEARKIGGLGIFLVKKNMDFVWYEYKDNKNIFTLKKKI